MELPTTSRFHGAAPTDAEPTWDDKQDIKAALASEPDTLEDLEDYDG